MSHAKINLQRMLSWIEDCLDADRSTPADAEICDRFGFETTEAARTLLAELADAGKITIRGYGDTRLISLGRTKGGFAPAARPEPSVKKPDAKVDEAAARVMAIVRHGRAPAAAVLASNAGALLKAVAATPATKTAPPPIQEKPVMPAKSVQLPATATVAIQAVEEHAKINGVSMGAAAANLIELGADKIKAPPTPAAGSGGGFEELLDQLRAKFVERPDLTAELAAAQSRAEAAEGKLAQLKALFA